MSNKTKPVQESNSVLGVGVSDPGAHSSTEDSVTHYGLADAVGGAERAQFDDAQDDIPATRDPNLTGRTPTEAVYTWLAGPITGWQDNDDYREFFEPTVAVESRLFACHDQRDYDYDDNGGVPTAIGDHRGVHGTRPAAGGGDDERDEFRGRFDINVNQRRI